MADSTSLCTPPRCFELTAAQPAIGLWANYGFRIWGQNIVWEGGGYPSFWLTSFDPADPPTFKQGIPLLIAQYYNNSGDGWSVITFELCRWNHGGQVYNGPIAARLFHGPGAPDYYTRNVLPAIVTSLNTWEFTSERTVQSTCHLFPTLVELTRAENHSFVFELQVGKNLRVERVTMQKL
jgi:hypothetical protein